MCSPARVIIGVYFFEYDGLNVTVDGSYYLDMLNDSFISSLPAKIKIPVRRNDFVYSYWCFKPTEREASELVDFQKNGVSLDHTPLQSKLCLARFFCGVWRVHLNMSKDIEALEFVVGIEIWKIFLMTLQNVIRSFRKRISKWKERRGGIYLLGVLSKK